ncbi:MAG TPA: efflux RND transporter periplasmic adaptor subunit [Verrucomicrobiae bacterium]|nr:efflux RND transporter periplasmic adaptor subunit [Verrucomicrobiae bacterium]
MNHSTSKTFAPAPAPPAPSTADAAARAGTKLRHAAMVAAALIIIGALAGLLPRWQHRAALRAEAHELSVQTVKVVSPAPGQAAAGLALPAEVTPYLEAPIYARASGYLKRYLVDIGSQVRAGDLLAEIDTPELNQELAQARAQLAQAQASLTLAKVTAARWADLVKTASVSEQEAIEKQADFELKKATVQAAQANVVRLEELQHFEQVTAPFDGTITARGTDVGQLISAASGKELFRLAQTGILRVYVRVPDVVTGDVVPGQMAELSVPELPGRVFRAKIVRASRAMSAASRTMLTELQVDNSRGEILVGSYAQVRFTEAKPEATLTLPSNTLLFRKEGMQVGVVQPDGKVELRKVTLGRDFGPTVEIIAGVGPTDRVILNPADSLVSGIEVRVAKPPTNSLTEK